MKGQLKRFRERQQQAIKRSYTNAVSIYEQTLQQVVAAAPGAQRQDDRDLVLKMRPGVIYAMRCPPGWEASQRLIDQRAPGFSNFGNISFFQISAVMVLSVRRHEARWPAVTCVSSAKVCAI